MEEDNDKIQLIDVAVGDKDGLPFLVVRNKNQFKDALEKLKKNAGEGNYNYVVDGGTTIYDEDGEDDDEVEHFAPSTLNDYKKGMLLPYDATQINWLDKENIVLLEGRDESEQITCSLELNRVVYSRIFPEKSIEIAYMKEGDWIDMALENFDENEFKDVEKGSAMLLEIAESNGSMDGIEDVLFDSLQNSDNIYLHHLAYQMSCATEDWDFEKKVRNLIEKKFEINFSFKILFALVALLNENNEDKFVKLLSTTDNFFELFLGAETKVLPRDLFNFWLFKMEQSCNVEDIEKAFYYYNCITHTFETSLLLVIVQGKLLDLARTVNDNAS